MKNINLLLTNTTVFIVVIFVTIFSMVVNLRPLADAQKEVENAKQSYNEIKIEKRNRNEELNLLNDKETQAQMVRGTYQISKGNEILFEFPEGTKDAN